MKATGYGIITEPYAPAKELDTFTCVHCNKVVICRSSSPDIKPEESGFCRLCYDHLCVKCADLGKCEPFEEKLRMAERRDQFRRELS